MPLLRLNNGQTVAQHACEAAEMGSTVSYNTRLCLRLAQIVAGLDEGLASMRVGGLRRLFIPGTLAFPKGLPSGPGRCAGCPAQPCHGFSCNVDPACQVLQEPSP